MKKIINFRRFFGSKNFDIVGLQEYDTYIKQDHSVTSLNGLFNHWFTSEISTGSWESLQSRYYLFDTGRAQLSNERWYVYGSFYYGDKKIFLINVHLSPGHSAEAAATRLTEANEILTLLSDKTYFIMFGDFNPEPGEEDTLFKVFTDAGYNLANCDFFGKFWTWSSNRADFSSDVPTGTVYYIDNIITSSNISINNAYKVNTYADLTSDHIPIVAELTIN